MRISPKILLIRSLKIANPTLAKEWHPTKNKKLAPKDVTAGSNKKAWWQCSNNSKHEWKATVATRNSGYGCPYCSGQAVCEDNCLATVNPTVAHEWHRTKNGNLSPKDVIRSSGKKAWWSCNRGHEWKARVVDRTKGYGCPYPPNVKYADYFRQLEREARENGRGLWSDTALAKKEDYYVASSIP